MTRAHRRTAEPPTASVGGKARAARDQERAGDRGRPQRRPERASGTARRRSICTRRQAVGTRPQTATSVTGTAVPSATPTSPSDRTSAMLSAEVADRHQADEGREPPVHARALEDDRGRGGAHANDHDERQDLHDRGRRGERGPDPRRQERVRQERQPAGDRKHRRERQPRALHEDRRGAVPRAGRRRSRPRWERAPRSADWTASA